MTKAERDQKKKEVVELATSAGLPEPEAVPWRCSSNSAMAEAMGLSRQDFQYHKKEGGAGFPKKSSAGWVSVDVIKWFKGQGLLEDSKSGGTLAEARARKLIADAEKVELQLEKARGELVSVTEVEREWSSILQKQNSTVEKEFHNLAPKLSGLDAPAILVELKSFWREVRKVVANE